ncbi:MAG: CtrA inhibitor SciP [Rhodospirillales bacterium]
MAGEGRPRRGRHMDKFAPGLGMAVVGPQGRPMSISDLPPPNTKRWVIRRKAEVVAAVRAGLLSLDEACERYKLSVEEFLSWQRLIDRHGMRGLRATRLQEYRSIPDAAD